MNRSTSKYDKILALYEDFQKYTGLFTSDNLKFISYASPSSLHSSVSKTAYGPALAKDCIVLSGGGMLKVQVNLADRLNRRYYLKLNCCLEQWQELCNDIDIRINDNEFYHSEQEFIENICQGWPSLYYAVDTGYLKEGENLIEIRTNDTNKAGLLISEVCLISLPAFEKFTQVSCIKAVRQERGFTIAIYTGGENRAVKFISTGDIYEYKGYLTSPNNPKIILLKFSALNPGCSPVMVEFEGKPESLALIMPEVVSHSDDQCLVGIDSDDHRHDTSDEADRILKVFAFTGMGDLIQFRPSRGRTHLEFAGKDVWKNRVDFLKNMYVNISIADTRQHLMEFIPEMAGDSYYGCHIHEPYLFFCLPLENTRHKDVFMLDSKAVLSSESYGESEKLYRDVLKKTYNKNSTLTGLTSVGSASLLCVYEAAEKFDRITLEPVSNLNLLTGAVRGTTGTKKLWGSHIPVDWYFGAPNDSCKSRKFRLAMNYLYISGAQYIYCENDVFKTNAFSREDWESRFTSDNRKYLRDFYEYTVRNPRKGELSVEKGIIYGRHEHFYWHYDDRMAELKDMQNWDRKVWGKWDDDSYRKCWRAIDSWLPASSSQYTYEDDVNKKLFSGTPYGNVDILPWWENYSKYKTLAVLGWNTMNDEMLNKLKQFVFNGGTLFISYCHFNTTDRNDLPQVFTPAEELQEFLGVKIGSIRDVSGNVVFEDGFRSTSDAGKLRLVECEPVNASVLASDGNGSGVYFHNYYEKGRVYFGAFADYFHEDWAVLCARHVMDIIGSESGTFSSNPNIAFTERKLDSGHAIIDAVNMNCAVEDGEESFSLKINGKLIEGVIREGEIKTFVL